MKRFKGFKLLVALLVAFVCAIAASFCFGAISTGVAVLAAPPVVLDPQMITFMRTLSDEYKAIDTWLNSTEDLSAWVVDGQTLRFNEADKSPAVYKNSVTDIDSVEPFETIHDVPLDVYDSQNYKLRNIYLHALPFEKALFYLKKSAEAIVEQEVADSAYNLMAPEPGRKRVIIPTTGDAVNGLKTMTLTDVVTLAKACDREAFPKNGRNLVLPSDMWWELVDSNPILKGRLERQPQNGIILPEVVDYYGFKIHKSEQHLGVAWDLSSNKKAAQGAVIGGDVVPAAFIFCTSQTFRASGHFMQFRKPIEQNTTGRADEFGFQHRFKAGHQMKDLRYTGVIFAAR